MEISRQNKWVKTSVNGEK